MCSDSTHHYGSSSRGGILDQTRSIRRGWVGCRRRLRLRRRRCWRNQSVEERIEGLVLPACAERMRKRERRRGVREELDQGRGREGKKHAKQSKSVLFSLVITKRGPDGWQVVNKLCFKIQIQEKK